MKRALLLTLLFLLFLLVGCGTNGDLPTEEPTPSDVPTGGYKDPTHTTGSYTVKYVLRDKTVTQFYELGELPEPPVPVPVVVGFYRYTFSAWDREIVAVTESTVYTAKYESAISEYTATFRYAGGRQTAVTAAYGTIAEAPTVGDYRGKKFACWDVEPYASTEDVTYTAIYVSVTHPEAMKAAYYSEPYFSEFQIYHDACHMVATYTMLFEEHAAPGEDGKLARRILSDLEGLVAEKSGLTFDCSTNWNYPITALCVAMAKMTPTVWNRLSESTKERLDTLMEGLAYIASFGTSDSNHYYTGPSLKGNYHKSYNPNYRFGNLAMLPFLTYYFGDGCPDTGADYLNGCIKSFDRARYERMIERFRIYGWETALAVWTTEGLTAPDGTRSINTARDLLVSGGSVMALSTNGKTITARGHGLGVNNGRSDYRYTGYQGLTFTLYEADAILRDVILYNYSGGEVKNEYYYEDKKIGGILDGTSSPYLGMDGMMLEFGVKDRSSTIYTAHDFLLAVPLISGARTLIRYDASGERMTDRNGDGIPLWDATEEETLWQKIQVGNEDHIYKYVHGYQCYSTGSYGVLARNDYEKNASEGYFLMKYLWRTTLLPLGTIPAADAFPE